MKTPARLQLALAISPPWPEAAWGIASSLKRLTLDSCPRGHGTEAGPWGWEGVGHLASQCSEAALDSADHGQSECQGGCEGPRAVFRDPHPPARAPQAWLERPISSASARSGSLQLPLARPA